MADGDAIGGQWTADPLRTPVDVVPVLKEAVHPDHGGRIGIVEAAVIDRFCTLELTYRDWPQRGDEPGWPQWRLRDARSGDDLAPRGGSGGGGRAPDGRWSMTFHPRVELPALTRSLRATDPEGVLDVTFDVTPAPAEEWHGAFRFVDAPEHPQLHDHVAQVSLSGLHADALPESVHALAAEPLDTTLGVVRPVALQRWRGCDVLEVVWDPTSWESWHEVRWATWNRDGGEELGGPFAGHGSLGLGTWLQVAFPAGP